jgi:hypothetical protein
MPESQLRQFDIQPVDLLPALVGHEYLGTVGCATASGSERTGKSLQAFQKQDRFGTVLPDLDSPHSGARLGLPRASAVVGSVGSSFVLGEGIHPGPLAK